MKIQIIDYMKCIFHANNTKRGRTETENSFNSLFYVSYSVKIVLYAIIFALFSIFNFRSTVSSQKTRSSFYNQFIDPDCSKLSHKKNIFKQF